MNRKLYAIITSLILAASLASPVMAASTKSSGRKTYTTEVTNNVSIGDINIELYEYTVNDEGKEEPMPYKSIVLPGDDLTQIVRIKNVARDAWVRIKLDFQSDYKLKGLDDSLITLASDEWKKIGDYYYGIKPVQSGTSVDFMKSIHIPEYWTEAYAEKEFRIVVTADAVQYKNFTPDFDSDDPWFGTIIEQCVHDVYEVPVAQSDKAFSVDFKGGAEGFIRTGDDFFSHWGEMMPGDTVEDSVDISNRYAKPIKLYFRTETIDDSNLVKQLDLTIKDQNGKVIFNDKMDKALKKTLLGEYKSNTKGKLTYTVHVPEELNNAYALSKAKTKWIFETELDESGNADKTLGNPQTGDVQKYMFLVLAIMAAIGAAVVAGRRKNEK